MRLYKIVLHPHCKLLLLVLFCLPISTLFGQKFNIEGQLTPEKEIAAKVAYSLVQNDYETVYAYFDDRLSEQIDLDNLQKTWEQVLMGTGPYEAVERIYQQRERPGESYEVIKVQTRFADNRLVLSLTVTEEGKIAGLFFLPYQYQGPFPLPSYADRADFETRQLTLAAQPEYPLPAVLTLPTREPNHPPPLLVLVHGSGPNDMDETVGGSKIFRDLAVGLAGRGVATLRYDKRTKAYQAELAGRSDLTLEEAVRADAREALRIADSLHKAGEVGAVFLAGHSLGAYLAPWIAHTYQQNHPQNNLQGLILLAAPHKSMPQLILEQTKYLLKRRGLTEAERRQLTILQQQVALAESDTLSEDVPARELPLQQPAVFWLELQHYAIDDSLQATALPAIVLHGGRDYQVNDANFEQWRALAATYPKLELERFPALNHLLIPGEGDSTPGEYNELGHLSTEVVQRIARFVQANSSTTK